MSRGLSFVCLALFAFACGGPAVGVVASPEFPVGVNACRGGAGEIQCNGPDRYQIKGASDTTCVAGNDDWYLRSVDVDLDRSRLVGTAHDATIYFKGAPIL